MQYALLIYEDETNWETSSAEEMDASMAAHGAFSEHAGERLRGGEALQPTTTATTVRVRNGERLLTDGPYAETREQFGGFYLVDVESLDEALDLAARIPGVDTGCVEVRPVMTIEDMQRDIQAAAS